MWQITGQGLELRYQSGASVSLMPSYTAVPKVDTSKTLFIVTVYIQVWKPLVKHVWKNCINNVGADADTHAYADAYAHSNGKPKLI